MRAERESKKGGMPNEPEGVSERRRMMDGDDPEKASVAAFELGVYFTDGGRADDAKACFQRAIELGHPLVVPTATLNLAGLFANSGRDAEAEPLFRSLRASTDPTIRPIVAYGLGAILGRRKGHEDEAAALLKEAAETANYAHVTLAWYDLGTLLSAIPHRRAEAIAALTRASDCGDTTYAPRAWFNLGVLHARAGETDAAETAYRSAIASGQQDVAPMAWVNLGNMLEHLPDRMHEAADAYMEAIASKHPEQAPLAAANLGIFLSKFPDSRAAAETAFRFAIKSGHPSHGPRANYNFGVMLLEDPARRADAEAAFRAVVASGDPEHAPLALYNLGRLIAEDPARWPEARDILRAATASSNQRVAAAAAHLIDSINEAERIECFAPSETTTWRCISSVVQGAFRLHEFLLVGQSLDDWTEILTITTLSDSTAPTPRARMDAIRSDIESKIIDGCLEWEVILESPTELIYQSTLAGDAAALDQTEITRILHTPTGLHTIQHAMRGDLDQTHAIRGERLARLRDASLSRRDPPTAEPPDVIDEDTVGEVLAAVGNPTATDRPDRAALCRRGLAALSKRAAPTRWAALQLLLGQSLVLAAGRRDAESPLADGEVREAIVALRRALEVVSRIDEPEFRGRVMHTLGFAWAERARMLDAGAAPNPKADADAAHAHAVAMFRAAAKCFAVGSGEWARIMLDLGRMQERRDGAAAAATFSEMLGAIENSPPLGGQANEPVLKERADLVMKAIARIRWIERRGYAEPTVPPGFRERKRRGNLLFLRPLITSGHLTLENRCEVPAFEVTFDPEPRQITLESLLYRVVGPELLFMALGGRPEGFGGDRLIMVAGGTEWHAMIEFLAEQASLIAMVPHVSEGVRWEVELLVRTGKIERTLMIMPPASTDTDAAAMWSGASGMMREHGLRLPVFRSTGAVLRFGAGGAVAEEWSFDTLWKNTFVREIEHLLPERGLSPQEVARE
jgi:tetratricopeptide (TPR) repeat protein